MVDAIAPLEIVVGAAGLKLAGAMSDPTNDDDIDGEFAEARLRRRAPSEYLTLRLGESGRDRLIAAIDNGVPAGAFAVIGRWWQFESYLRLLVYIELLALHGGEWPSALPLNVVKQTTKRADATGDLAYMASSDDSYLVAHLDVSHLFELIDQNWTQCSSGIGMPQSIWKGKVDELKPIRHRMAHCRRPHTDDADRIEQMLRDLEPAANQLLRRYTGWMEVRSDLNDPIVEDWARRAHPVARRLVDHGRERKGISFELHASALSWANNEDALVTGMPGRFWVMHAVIDEGTIRLAEYWKHPAVSASRPFIGHVIQQWPSQVAVTFPAVGDPAEISNAIGKCFEAVFSVRRHGFEDEGLHYGLSQTDPRVDADGILSVLASLNWDDPITLFEAAGF